MSNSPTDITNKNIKEIYEHERLELENTSRLHQLAGKVTKVCGSVPFIVFHIIFFSSWIVLSSVGPWKLDPFPFTFLMFLVSLESIFLTSFILIGQNINANIADRRHQLDLQINLLAESETTEILKVLCLISEKLEIDENELKVVRSLSQKLKPTEVLEQIIDVEKDAG